MAQWPDSLIEAFIKGIVDWMQRCVPAYDPHAWNDDDAVRLNNNCYNYACDIPTGTKAQPGLAHGFSFSSDSIDCETLIKGALADGLDPVDCDGGCGCSECSHKVALVIRKGTISGGSNPVLDQLKAKNPDKFYVSDFHWYRKDRDGNWSHKIGSSPATNLDNSGNVITDPRTADRGKYTIFCRCFCVNKSKVSIK